MLKALVLVTTLITTPAFAQQASCIATAAPVKAYLAQSPDWRISEVTDLTPHDQGLWKQMAGAACPGLVSFMPDASGRPAYGLLLKKVGATEPVEQLIILKSDDSAYAPHLIHPPKAGRGVIQVAKPGQYKTTEAGPGKATPFVLTHEGLEYIHFEAAASVIYLENGHFREQWIAD